MDYEFVKCTTSARLKVDDNYEFNESLQIGRGSYGVVYKVREKGEHENKKFYALKVIELAPYSPSTCREIAVSIRAVGLARNTAINQ